MRAGSILLLSSRLDPDIPESCCSCAVSICENYWTSFPSFGGPHQSGQRSDTSCSISSLRRQVVVPKAPSLLVSPGNIRILSHEGISVSILKA